MNRYSHQVLNNVRRVPLNDLLQATPVSALLSFLGHWPGAPEQDRSRDPRA